MLSTSPSGGASDGDAAQPAGTLSAVHQVNRLDIAQRHEQTLAIFQPHRESLKPKHAQLFFSNVEKVSATNAQQMKGICFNCKTPVSSTGASRFASHLSRCALVPADIRNAFKTLQLEAAKRRSAKRDALVLAAEEPELAARDHIVQQAALKQFVRAGLCSAEAAADKAIAEFMYANGISFSVASSEATSLYRTMVRAIQNAPAGYTPPTQKKLAGPLLDECFQFKREDVD